MGRPAKRLKSAAEHESDMPAGDIAPMLAPAPASAEFSVQGQQSITDQIRAMCANAHRQKRLRLNAPAGAPAPATAPATPPSTDPELNRAFHGSQGPQISFAEDASSGGDTVPFSPLDANNSRVNLVSRIGPEVQFGECGRKPRWVVVPAPRDKVSTFDWRLEAGTPNLWNGLTHEQLVEYAYMYLEHALDDAVFRERFRREIETGSFSHYLPPYIEDTLPPLPDAPNTNWFCNADEMYFYYRHQSPFVALKPGVRGYQVDGNSPIVGGRRSVESFNGQLSENEQTPSRIVETALPSGYHNGIQEPPPQLTHAWDHANKHPIRHPFNGYLYPGPDAPSLKHMVNEHSHNPPNGLPSVNLSDVMPRTRTKQTSKKTARTFPKEPHTNNKPADETEFMRFEREAIESLKDDQKCAKTFPRRTFRRFRPWAGYEDATKYIKREDLARLPRFPTAQRAFNPRVGVRAAPTSRTSCTSKPAKPAKSTKTTKIAKTANTNRTPETSNDRNPRRNPPRNRRKPERYLYSRL